MTEDISPAEWQDPGCTCDIEYGCGGDCCPSYFYTCTMHKERGMHASDIYYAWLDGDEDS